MTFDNLRQDFRLAVRIRTGAPGLMNVVLRTTLPPATLRQSIERAVREADPSVPIVRLRDMIIATE